MQPQGRSGKHGTLEKGGGCELQGGENIQIVLVFICPRLLCCRPVACSLINAQVSQAGLYVSLLASFVLTELAK